MLPVKPKTHYSARLNSMPNHHYVVQNNQAYEITEVGLLIWGLCDGEHSVDQIADQITKEYDIDIDQAKQDVTEFITNLHTIGLIR